MMHASPPATTPHHVALRDVKTEAIIGRGAFSNVYKVHLLSKDNNCRSSSSSGSSSKKTVQFAMKCLNPKRIGGCEAKRAMASLDLALESSLLSRLDHPNIVQLRAASSSGSIGHYMVLELLKETLEDRLQRWRWQTKQRSRGRRSNSFNNSSDDSNNNSQDDSQKSQQQMASRKEEGSLLGCSPAPRRRHLFRRSSSSWSNWSFSNRERSTSTSPQRSGGGSDEAVSVASSCPSFITNTTTTATTTTISLHTRIRQVMPGLAQALRYLHSQGIVFRDLKPQNVGFSQDDGTVKLFDFGFARHVSEVAPNELAGTFRYMAPERMVFYKDAKEQPDGHQHELLKAADVYSLGVLLWELATLERPYQELLSQGVLRSELYTKIYDQGWRHSVDGIPCPQIQRLVEACWHPDPGQRPDFGVICATLEDILSS